MTEDFALNVVLKALKQAKKGKIIIKDDLQFRIAITIISNSPNKKRLIEQLKKEGKK